MNYSDNVFDYYDEDSSGYIDDVEFTYVITYIVGALNMDPPTP